jgi:hypothetical protein
MALRTDSGIIMSGFPDARLAKPFRPAIAFQIASRLLMGMAATSGLIMETFAWFIFRFLLTLFEH